MRGWYYVSYNFAHSRGSGFGNIELELAGPPQAGGAGVKALAEVIVQISRERRTMPADAKVSVVAWSRLTG